jgi:hypothetical protein
MAKKKTFTNAALQQFANAWLAKGNAPTQQMIDAGFVKGTQTPNAPAQPFLTGEQQLSQVDSQTQHDSQVQDLLNQLAQAQVQAGYQKKDIERARVGGVSNSQDDAAARGIFQSSIKDGQIYDINAQAAQHQQQVSDQLTALQSSVSSRINLLDEALRRSAGAFNQMGVDNASQIDTGSSTSYASANPSPAAGQSPGAKAQPKARTRSKMPIHRSSAFGGYSGPYM